MAMKRKRLRLVTFRYEPLMPEERESVRTSALAAAIFKRLLGERDREQFAALHLDAKNQLLSCEIVSTGTLSSALVHPREVFKAAILQNAAAIIVAHNHPSGDELPSKEDLVLMTRLRSAGELLGVSVIDFLIVTGNSAYWSGADSGFEV